MKEASPAFPHTDRIRSLASTKTYGGYRGPARRPATDVLPVSSRDLPYPSASHAPHAYPDLCPGPGRRYGPGPSSGSGSFNSVNSVNSINSANSDPGPAAAGPIAFALGLRGGAGPDAPDFHRQPAPAHRKDTSGPRASPPAASSPSQEQGSVLDGARLAPDHKNSSSNNNNNNSNNTTSNNSTSASSASSAITPDGTDHEAHAHAHASGDGDGDGDDPKPSIFMRFIRVIKIVLFHSWFNVLLIFVPVGIAVECIPGMRPEVIFSMNAIAIIPLAGLLSHATETVAHSLGDAIGALLNVTFGNAVELIIFIIALTNNQIRIVQASLLGSILANLLLILGMAFFLGGLRYREQIYNSTVTQMSACLLSLSVISLVLPTAFHASFKDNATADAESLKISRGTSVILLLVYIMYLLFQLKSHAYMYESTPQQIIDEECTPGPVANWLDTSSSDDGSSSSSDSDSSGHSRNTVSKRVKRAIRRGGRRKSSVTSVDTGDMLSARTASFGTTNANPGQEDGPPADDHHHHHHHHRRPAMFQRFGSLEGSEEAIEDEKPVSKPKKHHRRHSLKRSKRRVKKVAASAENIPGELPTPDGMENQEKESPAGEPRRVDFAVADVASASASVSADDGTVNEANLNNTSKRPFKPLRGMSFRPVAKSLAPTVFTQPPEPLGPGMTGPTSDPVPRVRYGIRRTNSLPDRLNDQQQYIRPPGAMLPTRVPLAALSNGAAAEKKSKDSAPQLSRLSAIFVLLISTGLVAVCADFMVGSIQDVVETSSVKEIFIGLIILPIVGNAAEHVTAVVVAMKNKMDLAIGVAVGSSIQIALFITPLVVILGWMMDKEMTLYFTLFETVCLFVSAFIVNFLVLDGRSNYLEGALLCATYVIIGVVAFYYPDPEQASAWGA